MITVFKMSTLSIHQKSCSKKLSKFVMNTLNVNLKMSEGTSFSKSFWEKGTKKVWRPVTQGPQKHHVNTMEGDHSVPKGGTALSVLKMPLPPLRPVTLGTGPTVLRGGETRLSWTGIWTEVVCVTAPSPNHSAASTTVSQMGPLVTRPLPSLPSSPDM